MDLTSNLFDVAKNWLGQSSKSIQVLEAISELIGSKDRVASIAQQFEAQNLGHVFQSWVSTGANLPVSPDQIRAVLGAERVDAVAAKVGMSPEDLQHKLATVLPEIVNKLTPTGAFTHESFTMQNVLAAGKALITKH